jgi:hypothetical protein
MDPVTLVVAALAAGAAAGAGDVATEAIKDAYAGLKTALKRLFTGRPKGEETLTDYEADPDTYEKPLAKQLEEAGVGEDDEVQAAAERLLKLADQGGIKTKYHVTVNGGVVGIIGDHGHIEHFGTGPAASN